MKCLIKRPGYVGKRKSERYRGWDEEFGKGNWELIWIFGESLLDFNQACMIYTDAYYHDSFKREKLWRKIFRIGEDVYDNSTSNVSSGLDFNVQEATSTHIQDIAVRWVGLRRGWTFQGNHFVQIRGPESEGYELTPGVVEFHEPELIIPPDISPKWASPSSVEAFYQNNRFLAIRNS